MARRRLEARAPRLRAGAGVASVDEALQGAPLGAALGDVKECGREGGRVDDEQRWNRTRMTTFVKGAPVELAFCFCDEVIVDIRVDDDKFVAECNLRRKVGGHSKDEWQAELEVKLDEGGPVAAAL